MSQSRLIGMSEGLHSAVVSGRLVHPDHEVLNQHIADAVARSTPRGWLLDKSTDSAQIDAAVALAGAVARADQQKPQPQGLVGWV